MSIRGSERVSAGDEPGVGGIQGWVRGSGMIVTSQPRLTNVAGGKFAGRVGREEDSRGLSVRRLRIRRLPRRR